ncbi:MAG: LPS export ABC transporter periplasmic protein LptC [Treponema sp.]|nr:LPS export ABC transporter periplasmic protein LptC [Treponema sp.]
MKKKTPRWILAQALSIVFIAFTALSCSLEYDQVVHAEEYIPEIVFENAQFTRYENYSRVVRLVAEKLEQYKDTADAYAKSASFYTWDKGNLDTEGSCKYLSLNTREQIYTMFSDILIKNYSQDLELKAQNMKWNGNTEQLTAGAGETVYIRHEGLTMEGAGFSASGISRTYSFDYDVVGVYDDSADDSQDPTDETMEEKSE